MEEFLTKKDLCQWLKVSRATVDRWRQEGMPSKKIGRGVRFEKEAVLEWIEQKKQK